MKIELFSDEDDFRTILLGNKPYPELCFNPKDLKGIMCDYNSAVGSKANRVSDKQVTDEYIMHRDGRVRRGGVS